MQIEIRQQLSLGLGDGVTRSVQHVLLTPDSGPTQTVREWAIDMPGFDRAVRFTDAFGNIALLVTQTRPDPELVVRVTGVVETVDRNGVIGRPAGEPVPALYNRQTPLTKPIGAITQRFRSAPKGGTDRIALLHSLMDRVAEVLGESRSEPGQTQSQSSDGQSQSQSQSQGAPPAETPEAVAAEDAADAGRYAHAFIGAARALGIPARYVSGYYAGDEIGPHFHAWAEAFDLGLGWISFDPLLGYCPTDRHVRVAVGLDADSTMPIRSVPEIGEPTVLDMQVVAAQ